MKSVIEKVDYCNQLFDISIAHKPNNNGRLLLMLHGIGCAKEAFGAVFEDSELSEHFSLLALDFVGHGGSSKPETFSYSLADQAGVVAKLIEKFEPETIDVVGHSMGGAIGTLLVRDLAEIYSVNNFWNAEGNLIASDCGIASRHITAQTEEQFRRQGYDEFRIDLQNSADASTREWGLWYGQASPVAVHRSACSLVERSDSGQLLEIFNQLPVDTAFIYGDKSANHELLEHLRATDTNLAPITNSGHFMMLDNQAEFYSVIKSGL